MSRLRLSQPMPLAVQHNMADFADQAFMMFEKAILGKMQTPGVRAVSLQLLLVDPGADVISRQFISRQYAGNDEPRRTPLFQILPASMPSKGRFEHGRLDVSIDFTEDIDGDRQGFYY